MPDTPLIPRDVLWGNPDRISPRLSPDGSKIGYIAPAGGVLNVWVGPADDPGAAKAVSHETKRPIAGFRWAHTGRHVLYLRDEGGDENWHVVRVDLESGDVKDLTPFEGVQAHIQRVSHRHPDVVAIGMNDRDPELHDVYSVNVVTGERTLVEENPGLVGVLVDEDLKPRFASRYTQDGGVDVMRKTDGGWEVWTHVGQEDTATFDLIEIDETGAGVLAVDARERNTAALVRIGIDDGGVTVIAENEHADASDALITREGRRVLAAAFDRERTTWSVVDDSVAADFARIAEIDPGDVNIVSQTTDDRRWVLAFMHDDGPVTYYVYDRDAKTARFLFTHRDDLEGQPLASMRPVILRSRDGLDLVSYLSLPPGAVAPDYERPVKPLPMVLLVHGGPWARDAWGYNPIHQMLANRGYAVLSINFRGSTGFGKDFLNAGDREWARRMHDDLLDGVEWAVNSGIADPKRIAIMGGSYGGYATLVGLTMTPDVFACGVDIVGPSNLQTLIASMPPYWKPALQMFRDRVGDERTEEGRALLDERSPINYVDAIQRPLLIAQGANDPRVKQQESDQIVAAMQAKQIPVTYALFPDEGHGFARPQNNRAFFAAVESFLAEHLGGRVEPLTTADFEGASIEIRAGLEGVPGIAEVLPGVA